MLEPSVEQPMDRIARRPLLAGLLAAPFAFPAAAREGAAPRPLVVLLETNPWLMAVGSDSPSFALYDDGTVIYLADDRFMSAKLSADERDQLAASLDLPVLASLAGHYERSLATDQPTEYFFIFATEEPKVVSVYGSLKPGSMEARTPPPIIRAYDRLRAFRHRDARNWLPEKIEVMIWPYEYAPQPSIDWPSGWPGLSDPTTIRRGNDAYSLFVPSADYPALTAFLKTRNAKGAVKIDGHKWTASIRFPFPGERSWMSRRLWG